MTTIAVSAFVLCLAALALYRWGRKSHEVKTLKSDVKTGQKINETIKKQRDNHISDVDNADKFWLRVGSDKKD